MATLLKPLMATGAGSPDLSLGLYIDGTNFNDTLFGSAYADEIHGRNGADVLFGYGGDDFLFGDAGNDTLIGGAGADALDGGIGFDTASYAAAAGSVYVNLAANTGVYGDAQGDTFSSIEKVVGSNYSDVLVASDADVVFEGGGGHDFLTGGAGFDVLNGGAGNDTLEGGRGFDVLTGGTGADRFVFNGGDGFDLVTDFQQGVDKVVVNDSFRTFHQDVFGFDGELWTGTEVPTHWDSGPESFFYKTDSHELYYVVQGTPAGPTFALLASFENGVQLQTSDFIVL
jgi:Ca2+-binding RTX toxin-like protein